MVKVLVADENLETNLGCCNYLANDKELNISNVFNGLNVINKYYEDNPNVLVINSDFKDKNCTEIINDLSSSSQERNNCNILLTIDRIYKIIDFEYMSKIYRLFNAPVDYRKIKDSICQYNLDNYIFYEPTDYNLTMLFFKLNIYNETLGSMYLKYAIKECYKNYNLLNSLNDIYTMIAIKFGVSYESVRPAIRNSLKTMNNYRNSINNTGLFKLFENEDFITQKNFIRIITAYYLKRKK